MYDKIVGEHRVKFAAGTHLEPDTVHVQENEDIPEFLPEAHLGILRNHHTYKAEIPVPHSLGMDVYAQHMQSNLYVRVTDIEPTKKLDAPRQNGDEFLTTVIVQVRTIKEGKFRENIELVSRADESKKKVILTKATVILSRQGNPLLKTGVHVLSHEHTDESDFTEWPGHGQDNVED